MSCQVDNFFNERRYSEICDEFPCKIKYPKFYEANKKEIVIRPGQRVFIPAGWFHLVFSEGVDDDLGINMAINHWYKPADDFMEGVSNGTQPFVSEHSIPTNINPNDYIEHYIDVRVSHSKDRKFGTCAVEKAKLPVDSDYGMMKWGDFWKERDPNSYLVQVPFEWISQFKEDRPRYKESTLWMNFGNVNTYLHYDTDDNFLCQIKGTKRILFFPPEDRHLLYTLNPYSLDVVYKLGRCWNGWDYVERRDHGLRSKPHILEEIASNIKDETSEYSIENEEFYEEYFKCIDEYGNRINQIQGYFPKYSLPEPRFVVFNSPNIGKYEFLNEFVNVVVFVTPGVIRIANSEFNMDSGEMIIFPHVYTYTWNIEGNPIVIFPYKR